MIRPTVCENSGCSMNVLTEPLRVIDLFRDSARSIDRIPKKVEDRDEPCAC